MEKLRMMFSIILLFAYCYQLFVVVLSLGEEPPLAPALYVMGDSLLDSGNNNLLPTFARANFLPYGTNFAAGATGRFTNGKTAADFIAEFLGLPFPPPYLSRWLGGSAPVTGMNYASGSCGILPETGSDLGKCLSIGEQVNMFNQTVMMEVSRQYKSSEELSDYLSKSIFLIAIGSNDYINNYLLPSVYNTSRAHSPASFAELLVDALVVQIRRLYEMGARKMVVFEIGPIGCLPLFKHRNETCVEEYNQLVVMFNQQLGDVLRNLSTALRESQFVLGHGYSLGYDVFKSPSTYGLTDPNNPCCVTWREGTSVCIPEMKPCVDADKHYFWDGYHATEAFYRTVATLCVNGTSLCLPKNIKDLVRA